ncbi:unnamed protein product, partial [Adineta ricciae]
VTVSEVASKRRWIGRAEVKCHRILHLLQGDAPDKYGFSCFFI